MTKETTETAPATGSAAQKQALLEAFDNVLKQQAENREAERREEAERRRRRNRARPIVWAALVLLIFLCTYLYIERPEWVFPASAPPESVAIQEASLRIGMANVAQHLERYRQRRGRLPKTLQEAGTQVEGMIYQPLDSTEWRLIGSHAGIELTLASREPLSRFIGNSFEVISRRSR
jgi:hypothetical protein